MRVLVDTNVVVDVLLNREEHVAAAQQVLSLARHGAIQVILCATTITTIDYLVVKALGAPASSRTVKSLLSDYEIATVDAGALGRALELGFAEYEDAVLHAAGEAAGAEAIVTRDRDGFRRATLPVLSPAELVNLVRSER